MSEQTFPFGLIPGVFVLTGICLLVAMMALQFVRPERAQEQIEGPGDS